MIRWPYKWRKKEGCPFKIPHLAGAIYKWDCFVENVYIKTAKLPVSGVWKGAKRDKKLIVSLTTFPARIDACYYAIKSLMLQKYQADRIVLWLAESQFPDRILPKKYAELISRGLEIRYCEDLRSHKKYYYALQEQKEDELVATFDDDIVYEADALLKLMKKHYEYPDCVVCNRAHYITIGNGKLEAYKKWKICSAEGVEKPSARLMPSTGAGCLYPYGVMPESTFEIEKIKEKAFTADDIWMCYNRIANNVLAIKTKHKIAILCNVSNSQAEALTTINDIGGENQRIIDKLNEIFPDVERKLLDFIG